MRRIVRASARAASSVPAPEPDARYWETRVARNGRGGQLDTVANTLKAEAGATGIGDAAPMVLYNVSPEYGQGADLRATELTDGDPAPCLTSNPGQFVGDRGIKVVQETYNIVPEWGGGADLRAIPSDVSNAVTVTDHAKKTDRGIRVVVPISEPNSKYSPSSGGVTGSNACGAGIGEQGDPMYSLMASRPHAVAYEVDKERGIPNPEGIRVNETTTAPTITATGDPTERTDRGLRVLGQGTTAVRRLTPTECERLQGFPDGWTLVPPAPKKRKAK